MKVEVGLACAGGGVLGSGSGVVLDCGVEQDRERVREVRANGVVFVEVDLGEERLVAQPAGLVVSSLVDRGSAAEQIGAVFEFGAGIGVVAVVDPDPGADVIQLVGDPVLLLFEDGRVIASA